ncbi:MAG: hypothetical protein SLAVMIC_00113 [uncultured marine phage]|uniref:Uncharacterized protein n=1 Tax=uncultured marine phage TaxID=707152 RepID=A0A8D9C8D6_9VIRU|nr:MAG: hypothetical protein SLAVMIC_00113 [uncultured marine phage]
MGNLIFVRSGNKIVYVDHSKLKESNTASFDMTEYHRAWKENEHQGSSLTNFLKNLKEYQDLTDEQIKEIEKYILSFEDDDDGIERMFMED